MARSGKLPTDRAWAERRASSAPAEFPVNPVNPFRAWRVYRVGMAVALWAGPEEDETNMDAIRTRLEQELRNASARLRQMGVADALDELRPVGEGFADEVDGIQVNEWREIGFATRELLVDRVNRLSSALDRLDSGEYGTCVECGEDIAPARLRAMPEVETCVTCQEKLERYGRHLELVETATAGVVEED